MLDPVMMKYLAEMRQQEILDSIYGIRLVKPKSSLRRVLAEWWHRLQSWLASNHHPGHWLSPRARRV